MAGRSRQDVERIATQLAVGYVAMENGLWIGSNGKPLVDEHDRPKVVKRQLLEAAGIKGDKGYRYFEDPPSEGNHAATVFWREVAIERNRVRMGIKDAINSLHADMKQMGEAFLLELWGRFKTAPHSFTTPQLAKMGPEFIKVGIALEAAGRQKKEAETHSAIAATLGELQKSLAESPEVYAQLLSMTKNYFLNAANDVELFDSDSK